MISPEKAEEAKLKARYPNLGNKPGGSDLLRKRLQKGVSHPRWGLFSTKYLEICNFPIVIYICILNLFYQQPVHLQLRRRAVRGASAVPLSAAWLFSKFFFFTLAYGPRLVANAPNLCEGFRSFLMQTEVKC